MGVGKGKGHIVGPVCNQFASFSFHINQANDSWDRAISIIDLEKFKFKVVGEVTGESI